MKNKKTIISAIIMILAAAINTFFSVNLIYKENKIDTSTRCQVLSSGIYDMINESISIPINTSLTMANNSLLINTLEKEDKYTEDEMIKIMSEYLETLKNGLDTDTAFVISEKSKKYYSYDGFNKIIDPENDEHDIWYSIFINGRKKYDLDIDADQVNQNAWTVFINARIENKDGKLLGVCGVGMKMTEVQEIIKEYENNYGIKINLVNSEGLVQVDTDTINIETSYLYDIQYGKEHDGYTYMAEDGSCTTMKYVEDLNWYLVVKQSPSVIKSHTVKIIIGNICILIISLAVLIAVSSPKKEKNTE